MRWPFVRRTHYDTILDINNRLISCLSGYGETLGMQNATLGLQNVALRSIANVLEGASDSVTPRVGPSTSIPPS